MGSAVALVAWRTLELRSFSDTSQNDKQADWQAQRMASRFLNASTDILETPAQYAEGEPEALEGYLGWAGLCLAAASLGVRILPDDCHKALELAHQLNAIIENSHSHERQQTTFLQLINDTALLSPQVAESVARSVSQIALFYRLIE